VVHLKCLIAKNRGNYLVEMKTLSTKRNMVQIILQVTLRLLPSNQNLMLLLELTKNLKVLSNSMLMKRRKKKKGMRDLDKIIPNNKMINKNLKSVRTLSIIGLVQSLSSNL